MTVQTFTLRLNRAPTDAEVDALYEAGLDDAAVADATVMVDREAASMLGAVTSAVENIRSVPGLRAVGVDTGGDAVTLSDVAQRLDGRRTAESLRLLAAGKRGPGGFPAPIVDTGKIRVYSWAEVSAWLHDVLGDDVPRTSPDLALANSALALAAQAARQGHQAEVAQLLSA
jgi:hypothetical protein